MQVGGHIGCGRRCELVELGWTFGERGAMTEAGDLWSAPEACPARDML